MRVATLKVHIQGVGDMVQFEIEDHDLRDLSTLGERVGDAVVEALARAVQRKSGGMVVPCKQCGQHMDLVSSGSTGDLLHYQCGHRGCLNYLQPFSLDDLK